MDYQQKFIYQENHEPPDLPIAVLVHFLNYCVPHFFNLPQTVYQLLQLHLNGSQKHIS